MADTTSPAIPDELHADGSHDPADLMDAVAGIEAERDREIRCSGCGKVADAPYRTVLSYPRPWGDEERLQCQECWGQEATRYTNLDGREANVLALRLAGYDAQTIREVVGAAGGTPDSILEGLRAHLDELRSDQTKRERTKSVLAEAFGR